MSNLGNQQMSSFESTITSEARKAIEYTEFPLEYIEEKLTTDIAEFLADDSNFRSFHDGVLQQLKLLAERENNTKLLIAIAEKDDKVVLKSLKSLLKTKGVYTNRPGENEDLWFENKVLPTKQNAIKLCFAFELSSKSQPKTAGEFLFHVCQINGFNYRVADDIIFQYALEQDKSYTYALELIKKYDEKVKENGNIFNDGDETCSTQEIQEMFTEISTIDEDTFIAMLEQHSYDFIGYNKRAKREMQELYAKLCSLYSDEIKETNRSDDAAQAEGYLRDNRLTDIDIFDEIVFDFMIQALVAKKKGSDKINVRDSLTTILENFSDKTKLNALYNNSKDDRAETTADGKTIHHSYARGMYIILFFNWYILEWESVWQSNENYSNFFDLFYEELNERLQDCSYSALYPANPFDWLILKCAKLIDEDDSITENADIITIFTEVIKILGIM